MPMDELIFTVRAREMPAGKPVFHVIEQHESGHGERVLAVCPWLDDALRVALALSQAEGGVVNNETDQPPVREPLTGLFPDGAPVEAQDAPPVSGGAADAPAAEEEPIDWDSMPPVEETETPPETAQGAGGVEPVEEPE